MLSLGWLARSLALLRARQARLDYNEYTTQIEVRRQREEELEGTEGQPRIRQKRRLRSVPLSSFPIDFSLARWIAPDRLGFDGIEYTTQIVVGRRTNEIGNSLFFLLLRVSSSSSLMTSFQSCPHQLSLSSSFSSVLPLSCFVLLFLLCFFRFILLLASWLHFRVLWRLDSL